MYETSDGTFTSQTTEVYDMSDRIVSQLIVIENWLHAGYEPDAGEVMEIKAMLPTLLTFILRFDGTLYSPQLKDYYDREEIRTWEEIVTARGEQNVKA